MNPYPTPDQRLRALEELVLELVEDTSRANRTALSLLARTAGAQLPPELAELFDLAVRATGVCPTIATLLHRQLEAARCRACDLPHGLHVAACEQLSADPVCSRCHVPFSPDDWVARDAADQLVHHTQCPVPASTSAEDAPW